MDVTAIVPGAVTLPPGGGTVFNPTATIVLTGVSFPNAKLTLLKDGSITTTLVANSDGGFQITMNDLNFGVYNLSIYAEDPTGQTSSSFSVSVPAFSSQPYSYFTILIPPTFSTSSLLVEVGKSFSAFGYAPANSVVDIETASGDSLGSTTAGANGLYRLSITPNLTPGLYSLRARSSLNGSRSSYSKPSQVLFYKGDLPPDQIPTPPIQFAGCVDYNKDHHVNLVDFSILLFWFGKSPVPLSVDCNGDRVIDIKDFSILMYFWTS